MRDRQPSVLWNRARPVVGAGVVIVVLALGAAAVHVVGFDVQRAAAQREESWRIIDAEGRLLREAVGGTGLRSRWTPLAEISTLVQQSTVAVEDQAFFEHLGVDYGAVVRAAFSNLSARQIVSGASTLTMQLARMLRPHPRTLTGKLGEVVDAHRLELTLAKHEILEQYLNRASYGAGTVGVEAASQRYFGKPSLHLSLAEASLLAGLTQAPTRLNPLLDLDAARRRQQHVLDRLAATGQATSGEIARARTEELTLLREAPRPVAMHFTDYVLGLGPPSGEIRTTLDGDLQSLLGPMLTDHVQRLERGGLTNAAVVVLDSASCNIEAMVGSAAYWSADAGSVNGALARRQPGSALKPFTYALALEKGFSPASVLPDIETRYGDPKGRMYEPRNYDGRFSGPVLMADALGRSLNVPAIHLAREVGVKPLLARLRDGGFISLEASADHYGLGLTLGNGEVTLLELAQGYAAFARGGIGCRARALADQVPVETGRLFSETVSHQITAILSDEGLRRRAFGPTHPLQFAVPVAVKTGTSANWRDSWAVGFDERNVVAVWSGDFGNQPMHHLGGAIGAGPLFTRTMRLLHSRRPRTRPAVGWQRPAELEEVQVCARSGKLPSPACPRLSTVVVTEGQQPVETCTWHGHVDIDRRNGLRAGPGCPRRHVEQRVYEVLPASYATWQAEHHQPVPPARYSPLCPSTSRHPAELAIASPRSGEIFLVEPGYDRRTQTLRLQAVVSPPTPRITWMLDGTRVATAAWPYEARWQLERGRHRLEVVAGARRSEAVEFEVR